MKTFYWDETISIGKDGFILDVRTQDEFRAGSIEGAVNIPLDELRSRLAELPKDKVIYVYCQIGLRGYMAVRILLQNGFKEVYNLSGGYRLWDVAMREIRWVANKKVEGAVV